MRIPPLQKAAIVLTENHCGVIGFAAQIVERLRARGCAVYACGDAAAELGLPSTPDDEMYRAADFVLCLGGDGTMLRASHNARYGKPLLGINLGRLGYLTDADRRNAFASIDGVLAGGYSIERRMMLEIKHVKSAVGYDAAVGHPCLNDMCVTRAAFSKLIEVGLYINGTYTDTYRGDGIIVCTPTGSTAYNLSAGGPILKPDVEMMAVTPICAHKIYSRAIVISAQDVVTLKIAGDYDGECMLSLDGRHVRGLHAGDEVAVCRSAQYTDIIKTNNLSFFDILRRKMVAPEHASLPVEGGQPL